MPLDFSFFQDSKKRPQSNSFLDSLQYPSIDRSPRSNPKLSNQASDQPIQSLTSLSKSAPILPSTSMAQTPIPRSMPMNMPSMEEPEQDSTNFLGSLLAQGTAMLGAGIQGGDVGQVGRSFEAGRQRAEQDRKAKALVDPKSEESKRRRMVFEKALGSSIPEEYSATDLNDPVVLQSIRDKKMQEMAPKGGVVSGVRGGVGQGKPEKESKAQSDINKYTAQADSLKNQLIEYKKAVKSIPVFGGAAKIADAEALQKDILLTIKDIKKTGSLDEGSIKVIQGMIGTADYTRPEVVDSTINRSLQNLNRDVEKELRGTGTKNTKYTPYIPYNNPTPQEKVIIENYYSDPNDPDNINLYQALKAKKGF
jgi:hypothetical protein